MLQAAVALRVTDIHIDPASEGARVRFRIDGILQLWRTYSKEDGQRLINQVKAHAGMDIGAIFEPVGERLKWRMSNDAEIDLRVTLVPCVGGPKVAIRLLDCRRVIQRFDSLGLLPADRSHLEEWLATLNGMFLVTGPTSSGKTTTLYSLLHELAGEMRHVVTIEDPVEYEIDGINQMQVDQRHDLDFAAGVRASLRLDPDCVMVGEIREPNAALQAVNASVQGHVLLATMHSRDAVSAVTRLRNFGVLDHQIATAGGVIVNQRLVRCLCPECKQEEAVPAVLRSFFERADQEPPDRHWRAQGCLHCQQTGYHGRTGLFEFWRLTEADYEMILAAADEKVLRDHRRQLGQRFIHSDACAKVADGTTSYQEVLRIGIELPWDEIERN